MLGSIRLIASVAASRFMAPKMRPAAGCPDSNTSWGFVRFLSESSKGEIPAPKVRFTLRNLRDQVAMAEGNPLPTGLEVNVSAFGFTSCFLNTQFMTMNYRTAVGTVTYGNLSLNWLLRDAGEQDVYYISNVVTDAPNTDPDPPPPPGTPKTFLQNSYLVSADTYALELVGDGVKFHFEENSTGDIAIFTYLGETPALENKYYLQPKPPQASGPNIEDTDIIAKTGPAQYVFAFFTPDNP